MHVLPVILDARPPYLQGGAESLSLLQMPLGNGTYLERLLATFRSVSAGKATIVSPLAELPNYIDAIKAAGGDDVAVLTTAMFASQLARSELSDWIVLWDALRAPPDGLDIGAAYREAAQTHWIQRWLELESSPDGAREYVEVNPSGTVQRIRRYYDGITFVQVRHTAGLLATVATLQSACAGAKELDSLGRLHLSLVERGTLSRDVPLEQKIVDLRDESGLLSLAQSSIAALGADSKPAADVQIDPTARIVGPVHIQHGARIGARSTVIGPALIGSGAQVGEGAFVAHSVLAHEATVAAGARVMRRVVCTPSDDRDRIQRRPATVGSNEAVRPMRPNARTVRSVDAAVRRRQAYLSTKRWVEATLALAGLLVLLPLLLIVALVIVLDSRGGVFFGHEREGLGGKRFRCWKFRTMVATAHLQQRALYTQNAVDGPQFKLPRDPRVTRVGEFLRKSNLDELPQLINVVLGQMSLIGPRPSPFRENQICVPWRLARLSVRPGITGLWQICREDRDAGDFHQWIRFDSLYVKHVGLWLDVKIMFATLLSLGGRWSVPIEWIIADEHAAGSRFKRSSGPGFVALPIESSNRSPFAKHGHQRETSSTEPGP